VRLLLDEMVPRAVAEQLRSRGVEAVALTECALQGVPDAELFERAQRDGRAVVTYDRDHLALDHQWRAAGRTHHGVVLLNWHRFPQNRAATIGSLVRSLEAFAAASFPEGSLVHWLE
jgi:predicted nuclease of predicted toxin-antitoxin system